ncbi:NHL repeat-containing protein [Algoriphagus taiwanensis]|uniref:6-bladed beta-propeller n=1 Tax=Algoriphagus taiwanensis TaxID=1445656 RepID=A0ABQ6PXY3_9BACT|nr:hypothetical protein Ataiwa_04120 [Algoriphagus taiwanensis]
MKIVFFFFAIVFLFSSCKEIKNKEVTVLELIPEKVISEIDSLFFVNVNLASTKKDGNFILSQYPSYIAKVNSSFEKVWIYDQEGEGPMDLSYPEQLVLDGRNISILDHGNQSLKIFGMDSGTFMSSLRLPEPVMKFRFSKSTKGTYFFSVLDFVSNNSIIEVDSSGNLIRHLGTLFPETGVGSNRQMKYFQLDENDNIIFVGASLPYIEIVDYKGGNQKRYSLEQYEPIKRALDSTENDIKTNKRGMGTNSIPSYIIDAQYVKGRLYLSFTDRIGLDRSKARNLLEFKISTDGCELSRVFKFNTGTQDDEFHPQNFFVDEEGEKLLIQGLITKNIYEFKIPKEPT